MNRLHPTIPALLLVALLSTSGLAQPSAPGGPDAVAAVRASLDVERALLQEDTQRYRTLASRRARSIGQLEDLYHSLDAAVKRTDRGGAEAIRRVMDQIELAERDRAALLASERVVVSRIGERLSKIAMFEERVELMAAEAKQGRGLLGGVWRITMLPIEQRGTFRIDQAGTILSGTYNLEGGFTGSLQGTLVERKVYLVRIDSKLGRSMEFEGYVSADGERIRGTWLNYEMAGERGSNGQWAAERVEEP
jgi:hypothetical protein